MTHDTIPAGRAQFPLDYDRRLALTGEINGDLNANLGPTIFGVRPLGGLQFGLVGRYQSGLPYSKTNVAGDSIIGQINAERLPSQYDMDILLRRPLTLGRAHGSIYLDIRNLLSTVNEISVRRDTGSPFASDTVINAMATAAYNREPERHSVRVATVSAVRRYERRRRDLGIQRVVPALPGGGARLRPADLLLWTTAHRAVRGGMDVLRQRLAELTLLAALAACGQPSSRTIVVPPVTPPDSALRAPDGSRVPEGPLGRSILRGHALLAATGDSLPAHVGNALHCTSCHLDDGRRPGAMPLTGVYARFPQCSAASGRVISIADRVNGCLQRSMNGAALAPDDPAMRDIVNYLAFISKGIGVGDTVRVRAWPAGASPAGTRWPAPTCSRRVAPGVMAPTVAARRRPGRVGTAQFQHRRGDGAPEHHRRVRPRQHAARQRRHAPAAGRDGCRGVCRRTAPARLSRQGTRLALRRRAARRAVPDRPEPR